VRAYIAHSSWRGAPARSRLPKLLAAAGAAWKSIPTRPRPEKSAVRRPYAAARRADAAPESAACKPFFEGMSFVFTGELSAMARGAAEEAVMRRAGTVLGGVSRKVSVLVVGVQDPTVVRGAHSTKHQRALELRQAGHPIEIIDEAAFLLWLRGGLPDAVRR
jgi:NAD-dependent DNA ligase